MMEFDRRSFIKTAAASAASASLGSQAFAQAESKETNRVWTMPRSSSLSGKPKRPNLLFLWTDQHRADSVPWAGNAAVDAPALASLAEQSFVFHRAYVTQPVCTPSRASILTGTWPHNHGAIVNHIPLRKDLNTVAERVSSGYVNAYYGKWHLGDEIRAQHGFDDWISIDDSYWEDYTDPEDKHRFSDYYHFLMEKGFPPDDEEENPGEAVFSRYLAAALPEQYTKVSFLADRAEEFLRERKDGKPFTLHVSALEPHPPTYGPLNGEFDPDEMPTGPAFAVPVDDDASVLHRGVRDRLKEKGFKNHPIETEGDFRRLKANYYGLVKMVDNAYSRVLQALFESGQAENTIIVYTSDHGDMVGDHALMDKSVFYEGATRVPLTIHVPWLSQKRVDIEPLFSQIDLFPTLLGLMGLPITDDIDGQSRATQLEDGTGDWDKRIIVEWNDPARPDEAGRSVVTDDGWKLNLYRTGVPELFNLNTDPGELKNLAQKSTHRKRVAAMRNDLKAWQHQTGDVLEIFS